MSELQIQEQETLWMKTVRLFTVQKTTEIQNVFTGSMIIHRVLKADKGLYKCSRSWITRELADCHVWYPEEVFIISFCVFPFVMAAVLQLHHVMTRNWVSSLSHKVRNSSPKITAHFNLLLCVIKQILSSHSLTLQSWAVYGCKVSMLWPIYYLGVLGQTC